MPVAELWDPCTIPSDALVGAGVDPEVIESRPITEGVYEWKTCTYKKDWFYLTVYSTTRSLDELRAGSRVSRLSEVPVGSRTGIMYTDSTQPLGTNCYSSIASKSGAVEFEVQKSANNELQGDTCSLSVSFATSLEKFVPE
ncbi:MAG: DUF3558 family protein [Rhodococcus sp. (in: high G+C Gram-positive bacteria)]